MNVPAKIKSTTIASRFNDEQLQLIKDTICKGATDREYASGLSRTIASRTVFSSVRTDSIVASGRMRPNSCVIRCVRSDSIVALK